MTTPRGTSTHINGLPVARYRSAYINLGLIKLLAPTQYWNARASLMRNNDESAARHMVAAYIAIYNQPASQQLT